MAFTITTTRKAASEAGINVLVYGDAGAGKTSLCATCTEDHEKILIISCEGGLLALDDYDIPATIVETVADLHDVYGGLASYEHPYEWVCLDSVSEIAEVVLANEKADAADPRQAYGELGDIVFDLLRKFRDLPVNVLFTAKQDTKVIPGGKNSPDRAQHRPSMPGNALKNGIPYLFDEVLALRVERDEQGSTYRTLMTESDGDWTAKDRSGRLDAWEEPHIGNIAAKIRG